MSTQLPSRLTLLGTVVALLLAVLVAPAAPALADSGTEGQFVSRLNQERRSAGLAELPVDGELTAVARRHSERMARDANLHHNPNLGSDVSGWQKVGENVGRGPSADAIHQGFMNSPTHRQNILDADWTQVGVGVVVRDGQIWVTQVFRLPSGATAAAAAEPEPEPTPAPEPDTAGEPAGDAAAEDSTARASQDDPAPASGGPEGGQAQAADEPEPAGERHEVVSRPLALDRELVTLARLEAAERDSSISAELA